MIKIIAVLFCLPIISYATNDRGKTKPRTQLSKITSDTLKGRFDQIQITYDQLNRVVRICQTSNLLSKQTPDKITQSTTHFLRTQDFEYAGNNMYPTLRKRAVYKYDSAKGRDIIRDCQVQYFKYKDGKRVGDSIFNSYVLAYLRTSGKYGEIIGDTILQNERANADPEISHESEYKISSKDIYRKHTESFFDNPPNVFTDLVTFGLNLKKADYEVHQMNNDVFGYYFNFKQFDHATNPLKTLNIAPYISSEIFDFVSADSDPEGLPIEKGDPPCLPSNYLGWSFLNNNNPTSYTKNGSDGSTRNECPLKNYITLIYNYNKFNLPQRCTVTIKTINLRLPNDGKNIEGIEKKGFNFEYNN